MAQSCKQGIKSVRDDNIMGTNNSSIVSKRSVERLYYSEPHYFRYFVKKPRRRSPLINRGYWLRMQAIDNAIRSFLKQNSPNKKLIINLGCGSDVSAFQWLAKGLDSCRNVLFIDVDYPKLIAQKVEVIKESPQLVELIGNIESCGHLDGIHLQSSHYVALGCDLVQPLVLEQLLRRCTSITECTILFVAEVSMTYMDVIAADALLKWASTMPRAQFCLLEQMLPDGMDHPFAKKMIEHFQKLHSPLKSVLKYPSLAKQRSRLQSNGWFWTRAESLWQVWSDPLQISVEQRRAVDRAEAFDEWEEFVLFASHYFILVASNHKMDEEAVSACSSPQVCDGTSSVGQESKYPGHQSGLIFERGLQSSSSSRRRFGTVFQRHSRFGFYGGSGTKTRLDSTDLYEIDHDGRGAREDDDLDDMISLRDATARTCHAMATSADGISLLAGGRSTPEKPLSDCWLFDRSWSRVEDLPLPLYRHCMTWVSVSEGVCPGSGFLVYGGKSLGNQISDKWLLWQVSKGWKVIPTRGIAPGPIFGASLAATGRGRGLLAGGLTPVEVLESQLWDWRFCWQENQLYLEFLPSTLRNPDASGYISRLGAQLTACNGRLFIIGGVSNWVLSKDFECLELTAQHERPSTWSAAVSDFQIEAERPLLVGHSSIAFQDKIILIGGGAVCFSFGSVWNKDLLILRDSKSHPLLVRAVQPHNGSQNPSAPRNRHDHESHQASELQHQVCDGQMSPDPHNTELGNESRRQIAPFPFSRANVPVKTVPSWQVFASIIENREPVLLHKVDFGPCQQKWTLPYLRKKIGDQREIIVHEASDDHLDFLDKNFVYRKKAFGDFADEITDGSRQYLRSTAQDSRANQPANIAVDFPELGADIELPSALQRVRESFHSSVLRIAGNVSIWLHYDVMANILIQIAGSKRFVLYPPCDVDLFGLPAGASSSPVQVFDTEAMKDWPGLAASHPHEVELSAGDILFIPPLWLHAAQPKEQISIAVNIFFRDLDSGYAPGRDVYGNRDLQAYEKGRSEMKKMVRSFEHLPPEMSRFYLERLADELKDEARKRKLSPSRS